MSYYERHVFFCCNKRDPPEKCCADAGAADMQKHAKSRIKALKQKRDAALQAHDRAQLKHVRRGIHRLKRQIHKATV